MNADMTTGTQEIITAINEIKFHPNIFKDYVLPFVIPLFSAVFGYFVAVKLFARQEKTKAIIIKIERTNEFIIHMIDSLQSLIAIKEIYYRHITAEPYQRTLSITKIQVILNTNVINTAYMAFVSFGYNESSQGQYDETWNNVVRINTMVSNYRYLVKLISERNEASSDFLNAANEHIYNTGTVTHEINIEALTNKNKILLIGLMDKTEQLLRLVDDLIIEIYNFLTNIHTAVKSVLNVKLVKEHVTLLMYRNDAPEFQEMLARIIQPDYEALGLIFGLPEVQVRELYKSGYR